MTHSRVLLNDGSSAVLLNDGTSYVLLNAEGAAHEAAGHGGRSSRRRRQLQQEIFKEEITQFKINIFATPIIKTQYKLYFKKQGFLKDIFRLGIRSIPTTKTEFILPLRYKFSAITTQFQQRFKRNAFTRSLYKMGVIARPFLKSKYNKTVTARANTDTLVVKSLFDAIGVNNEPLDKEDSST